MGKTLFADGHVFSNLFFFFFPGEANVLAEFIITEGKKKIPVAGCRCVKGTLQREANYRIVRGEDVIHEGELCTALGLDPVLL